MYGNTDWWPRAKYAQLSVEKVQRYMLQQLTGKYTVPYEAMIERENKRLRKQKWTPLWKENIETSIIALHHYVSGTRKLAENPLKYSTGRRSKRTSNSKELAMLAANNSEATRSTLLHRTTAMWNKLPEEAVQMSTSRFKRYIRSGDFYKMVRIKSMVDDMKIEVN